MSDEVSALFSVSIYVESMLGLLLLFMWVQSLEIRAVAWWGSAHLLRAGSISLFGLYGEVQDLITIDFANVVLLTSFAATWTGTRLYAGRKINLRMLFAGGIIWLLAVQLPAFQQSIPLRSLLSSFIIAGYTWAAAAELWYCPNCPSVSRLPAIFLLFAHGSLFLLRTPLVVMLPHPPSTERVFGSIWLTVLSSEALLFTISIAFILMAMAKERAAYIHKAAAMIDPLTGVWNRRGLLAENERFFPTGNGAAEAAVLLIDLDNFKSINDRFGHAFGDRVLQMFAATACNAVRGSDVVGRLGGEEFAVVLYGLAEERALAVAERIRKVFAQQAEVIEGQNVGATVSIGLAVHDGYAIAFTELLWKADRALYRAKEAGRNRIEWAVPDFYARSHDAVPLGQALPRTSRDGSRRWAADAAQSLDPFYRSPPSWKSGLRSLL
jgi:diguanylate cyclase (GGDEF)-like protein